MKTCRVLLFFLLAACGALGQVRNDSLENRIRPDELRAGDLYLNISNFNYLRNYEFYNRFQDGYTLYGTQLEPQLVYYAHPNLSLSAGVHLRKDFGGEGIYKSYPLISIKYQKNNFTMINGVLEANIHHRFIEPIMDFEKKITDPVEYGTQFILDKKKYYLDAFVRWKRMIYKPSSEQEQIVAGASANIFLLNSKEVKLSVPLQFLVFHQGGQIDVVAAPLQTLFNEAAGLKLEIPSSGPIKNFRTENYFVGYTEFSPTKAQIFPKGHGVYLNAGADFKYGSLTASYWNGKNFIASQGMPLFQSVSQQIGYSGYSESKRELLFVRYAFQKELVPHFFFDFRVEPAVELHPAKPDTKTVQLYHSMFLVYKQDFRLIKKK